MVAISINTKKIVTTPPKDFKDVDGQQFTTVARFFDADHDGKLNADERQRASDTLHFIGKAFNNSGISNLGDAMDSLDNEIKLGNTMVDRDGDGCLQIDTYMKLQDGTTSADKSLLQSELAVVIGRNDKNKLQVADLRNPSNILPFKDIKADLAKAVFALFDKDNDGRLDVTELTNGRDLLNKVSTLLGNNDQLKNLANMMDSMRKAVVDGDAGVDEDGDGAVRYRDVQYTVDNPPPPGVSGSDGSGGGIVAQPYYRRYPFPQPNELNQIIARNNPDYLQSIDMHADVFYQNPYPVYPMMTTGMLPAQTDNPNA